mgnify:CR=1 FL=1
MMLVGDLVTQDIGADLTFLGEPGHNFAKPCPGVFDHRGSGTEHLEDGDLCWGQLP